MNPDDHRDSLFHAAKVTANMFDTLESIQDLVVKISHRLDEVDNKIRILEKKIPIQLIKANDFDNL
jgi:hypothetical protein